MSELRYAKEHAFARTFHRAFRLAEMFLPLGLMFAVSLEAQQSLPSAAAWTGVVRTAAGEPVAGAKVTAASVNARPRPREAPVMSHTFDINPLSAVPRMLAAEETVNSAILF